MGLLNMTEILEVANENYYSVGGFNINNLEFIKAIIEAANEMKAPVVLQAGEKAIKYMGIDYLMGMVGAAEKEVNIPIALHLDHGSSFESIMRCIRKGFSSVMIDGSKYPFEENITLTKKIVEAAHSVNVSVEAELGRIGGQEDEVISEVMLTDTQEALEFVNRTGVDALAIAIGTAHGVYKGEPKIDFERLKDIKSKINIPLVLHGASGLSEEDLKKAVSLGINKVNINTDFMQAFTYQVVEKIKNDPQVYDPREYLGPGKDGIVEKVKEKIELLGSDNKSSLYGN